MSSKCLVTGASGFLGRQIFKAFERDGWQTTGLAFTRAKPPSILKADLCDNAMIERVLDEVKPDVIVHSAAQRMPDKVDSDPDAARALNVESSANLANAASTRGIFLIYISTDYVFSGKEGEAPYETSAIPNPTNLYGQTKLDGEKVILSHGHNAVVLRVPVLYGPADQPKESAVNTLVDSVWKAQSVNVIMDDWAIRYPTNTEDCARVCVDVAKHYTTRTSSENLPRILQFSSEDRLTKYEICEIFAGILGLPMEKMERNKQGNDPNAKVQRPYDCHLSTSELKGLNIDTSAQDFRAWWRRELGAYRH